MLYVPRHLPNKLEYKGLCCISVHYQSRMVVPDNGFNSVCQLKWVYSITHPHSDVHRTHLILITHLW